MEPEPGGSKTRVLVAEDEPSILLSLEHVLREAGYDVSTVTDGAEAVRVVHLIRPALIVLDIMLPRLNGFEVCRQIRSAPSLNGTHVLILTARGPTPGMSDPNVAGADAYMQKPFSIMELMQKVSELAGPAVND